MPPKKKPFVFFKPPASIDKELGLLKSRPASYWEKKGETMV